MDVAWDITTNEFIYINDGEAEMYRELCRSGRLVCPYDLCDFADIQTVRGYANRAGTVVSDLFRHVAIAGVDTEHGPETQRHFDAKHALRRWLLRSGFDDARVERPVRLNAHTVRRRRPDVSANHGEPVKLAFEVQASSISDVDLDSRTADLEAAGYRVRWVWAWGSIDYTFALTTAFRSLDTGHGHWFIDTEHIDGHRLGWGYQDTEVAGEYVRDEIHDLAQPVRIAWAPLDSVTVSADGSLHHPSQHSASIARAEASRRKQDRDEQTTQTSQEAGRRLVERELEESKRLRTLRERDVAQRSFFAPRVFLPPRASEPPRQPQPASTTYPPGVMAILDRTDRCDYAIYRPTATWKAVVIERVRSGAGQATFPALFDFVKTSFRHDDNAVPVRVALSDLLNALETAGHLTKARGAYAWVDREQVLDSAYSQSDLGF